MTKPKRSREEKSQIISVPKKEMENFKTHRIVLVRLSDLGLANVITKILAICQVWLTTVARFGALPIARKSTKNKVLVPQLYLGCSKHLGFNDG